MEQKKLDIEAIKTAVTALMQTSATFSVGIRELKKTVDMEYGYNYEHFNRVSDFAKEIYNKIEDLEIELDSMEEESNEFEAAERKHKACIVTNVCTCERNVVFNTPRLVERNAPGICAVCGGETEHNWEVHYAEMRAETL